MKSGETEVRNAIWFVLACTASFLVLVVLYNLTPDHAPAAAASIADISFARCINHAQGTFNIACHNSGYPYGDPSTFGLPLDVIMAVILKSGVSSLTALRLAYSALLVVALAGCIKFFGSFAANKWVALLGGLLFLASPIVVFEDGYGPLRIGFALLPAYVYAHLATIRHFSDNPGPSLKTLPWVVALCAANTFAMFCDGYSFVMSLVLAGLFWAQWLFQRLRERELGTAIAGSSAALISLAIPVLLYKLYIPGANYSPMPLDFFRGQGVDLFFMGVPSDATWLARLTGLHHRFTAAQAYSDGPNSSLVYLGYVLLACTLLYSYWALKHRHESLRRIMPVLIAGLAALLLSLGPALKIHDIRPDASAGISMDMYMMPAGKATLELGTGWIYQHVPGIDIMRALYRWQLLVRLGLIVAAMCALTLLIQRGRRGIAIILGILLIADTLPPVNFVRARGASSHASLAKLETQLVGDVKASIPPKSRVIFLQLHPNASGNQFLASYICAEADLVCYNVGGDKATELASGSWPAPVFEIISGINPELNVREVFQSGLADVVAVPFFDMRMQAYSWPPRGFPVEQVKQKIAEKFGAYDVRMTPWFALIRPKTRTAAVAAPPAAFAEGQVSDIRKWGPQSVSAKSKSKTYVWIKADRFPVAASIAIDDHVLATAPSSEDVLAAPLRPVADQTILERPGKHAVYLIDRDARRRQLLGEITISK